MSAITVSSTAMAILAEAATNAHWRIALPDRLPAAARHAVGKSMLKAGLVEEIAAAAGEPAWRTAESGQPLALRATNAGLAAAGLAPQEQPAASSVQAGSTSGATKPPKCRVRLRDAAAAVVSAWDDTAAGRPALPGALDALRSALAQAPRRAPGLPRIPRTGTKQEMVLALLRRAEGASVAQVAEATGWAPHTVRGFFAGLNKKGFTVTVLERVRQVGSGKQGAKGNYTVYHVAEVS